MHCAEMVIIMKSSNIMGGWGIQRCILNVDGLCGNICCLHVLLKSVACTEGGGGSNIDGKVILTMSDFILLSPLSVFQPLPLTFITLIFLFGINKPIPPL